MRRNVTTLAVAALLATVSVAFSQTPSKQSSTAGEVEHAVAGTIVKVDDAAKTVTIKTARGTMETLKFTEQTMVSGSEAAARDVKGTAGAVLSSAKEGVDVIVHYVEKGGDKVATGVHEVGKESLKVTEGVVSRVDKGAHTVAIKGKDGTEQVFHYSEAGAVDTGRGVVKGTEALDRGLKEGEQVTVHYTESAGKRVAHLFTH